MSFKKNLKKEIDHHTRIEVCARARMVDSVSKLVSIHYIQQDNYGFTVNHFPNYSLN